MNPALHPPYREEIEMFVFKLQRPPLLHQDSPWHLVKGILPRCYLSVKRSRIHYVAMTTRYILHPSDISDDWWISSLLKHKLVTQACFHQEKRSMYDPIHLNYHIGGSSIFLPWFHIQVPHRLKDGNMQH